MNWKSFKHGILYGYLLNKVFKMFEVPRGWRVLKSVKMFTVISNLECECVKGKLKW